MPVSRGDCMPGIVLFIVVVVMGRILVRMKAENQFIRFRKLVFMLFVVSFVVFFCFFGENMVSDGKIHITERKMKVEFQKAEGREFSDRMKLGAGKALNVQSKCSQGKILLTVYQKQKEYTYDISKWDGILELGDFEEGYVNLHLNSEKARDVCVEITCAE